MWLSEYTTTIPNFKIPWANTNNTESYSLCGEMDGQFMGRHENGGGEARRRSGASLPRSAKQKVSRSGQPKSSKKAPSEFGYSHAIATGSLDVLLNVDGQFQEIVTRPASLDPSVDWSAKQTYRQNKIRWLPLKSLVRRCCRCPADADGTRDQQSPFLTHLSPFFSSLVQSIFGISSFLYKKSRVEKEYLRYVYQKQYVPTIFVFLMSSLIAGFAIAGVRYDLGDRMVIVICCVGIAGWLVIWSALSVLYSSPRFTNSLYHRYLTALSYDYGCMLSVGYLTCMALFLAGGDRWRCLASWDHSIVNDGSVGFFHSHHGAEFKKNGSISSLMAVSDASFRAQVAEDNDNNNTAANNNTSTPASEDSRLPIPLPPDEVDTRLAQQLFCESQVAWFSVATYLSVPMLSGPRFHLMPVVFLFNVIVYVAGIWHVGRLGGGISAQDDAGGNNENRGSFFVRPDSEIIGYSPQIGAVYQDFPVLSSSLTVLDLRADSFLLLVAFIAILYRYGAERSNRLQFRIFAFSNDQLRRTRQQRNALRKDIDQLVPHATRARLLEAAIPSRRKVLEREAAQIEARLDASDEKSIRQIVMSPLFKSQTKSFSSQNRIASQDLRQTARLGALSVGPTIDFSRRCSCAEIDVVHQERLFAATSDVSQALSILVFLRRHLVQLCDVAGLERISAHGDSFCVTSNMLSRRHTSPKVEGGDDSVCDPSIHHALLVSRFALAAVTQIRNMADVLSINKGQHRVQLRAGVHTAALYGGVTGETHVNYSLYGEAFECARALCRIAGPSEVIVSEATALCAGPQLVTFPMEKSVPIRRTPLSDGTRIDDVKELTIEALLALEATLEPTQRHAKGAFSGPGESSGDSSAADNRSDIADVPELPYNPLLSAFPFPLSGMGVASLPAVRVRQLKRVITQMPVEDALEKEAMTAVMMHTGGGESAVDITMAGEAVVAVESAARVVNLDSSSSRVKSAVDKPSPRGNGTAAASVENNVRQRTSRVSGNRDSRQHSRGRVASQSSASKDVLLSIHRRCNRRYSLHFFETLAYGIFERQFQNSRWRVSVEGTFLPALVPVCMVLYAWLTTVHAIHEAADGIVPSKIVDGLKVYPPEVRMDTRLSLPTILFLVTICASFLYAVCAFVIGLQGYVSAPLRVLAGILCVVGNFSAVVGASFVSGRGPIAYTSHIIAMCCLVGLSQAPFPALTNAIIILFCFLTHVITDRIDGGPIQWQAVSCSVLITIQAVVTCEWRQRIQRTAYADAFLAASAYEMAERDARQHAAVLRAAVPAPLQRQLLGMAGMQRDISREIGKIDVCIYSGAVVVALQFDGIVEEMTRRWGGASSATRMRQSPMHVLQRILQSLERSVENAANWYFALAGKTVCDVLSKSGPLTVLENDTLASFDGDGRHKPRRGRKGSLPEENSSETGLSLLARLTSSSKLKPLATSQPNSSDEEQASEKVAEAPVARKEKGGAKPPPAFKPLSSTATATAAKNALPSPPKASPRKDRASAATALDASSALHALPEVLEASAVDAPLSLFRIVGDTALLCGPLGKLSVNDAHDAGVHEASAMSAMYLLLHFLSTVKKESSAVRVSCGVAGGNIMSAVSRGSLPSCEVYGGAMLTAQSILAAVMNQRRAAASNPMVEDTCNDGCKELPPMRLHTFNNMVCMTADCVEAAVRGKQRWLGFAGDDGDSMGGEFHGDEILPALKEDWPTSADTAEEVAHRKRLYAIAMARRLEAFRELGRMQRRCKGDDPRAITLPEGQVVIVPVHFALGGNRNDTRSQSRTLTSRRASSNSNAAASAALGECDSKRAAPETSSPALQTSAASVALSVLLPIPASTEAPAPPATSSPISRRKLPQPMPTPLAQQTRRGDSASPLSGGRFIDFVNM